MLLQRAQSSTFGSQWPLVLTWLLMRAASAAVAVAVAALSRVELFELIIFIFFKCVPIFITWFRLPCRRLSAVVVVVRVIVAVVLLCLRLRWLFKISSCRDDAQRCAQSPPQFRSQSRSQSPSQSRSASHSVSVSVSVSVRVERASALAATSFSSYHLLAALDKVFWLVVVHFPF